MQIEADIRQLQFGPNDYWFLLTLSSAIILLLTGLTIPAFTNDRLAQDLQSFSIIGGALNLGRQGSPVFMLIILLFSAVFPITKLAAMLFMWLTKLTESMASQGMHWLEILGKWSMLDVFVVTITIGAAHLELLNKTIPESGIYIFGLAIILSMLASVFLRRQLKVEVILEVKHISVPARMLGISIGLLTLLVFFLGITLPLFQVEKWVFWDKQYSVITALPRMMAQGEYLLPLVIALFVILLPLLRFVALSITRLQQRPSRRLIKFSFGLEKWAMWEVYVFALIIVVIKLADFAQLELKLGFWLIAAVAPLSMLDGWLFKRRLRITYKDD